jgi:hypothetical protein
MAAKAPIQIDLPPIFAPSRRLIVFLFDDRGKNPPLGDDLKSRNASNR